MKLAKCYSGAICGVDARTVEIEVCASSGTVGFTIVGLPDQAVKEAKDRVITAISNSGFRRSEGCITVNLAPADVRKAGPIYDLPIAVSLLVAADKLRIPPERGELDDYAFAGELALSGDVRRVMGIVAIALEMRRIGKHAIFVPAENAAEAGIVDGIDVYPVRSLRETVDFLRGELEIRPVKRDLAALVAASRDTGDDFADVKGQSTAKRAMEVAVAGGHNMLMIGSPGSGKTMLARRIPSILPPLTAEEALEVTRIHSIAGIHKTADGEGLVLHRPFRAPHHTVSGIGLLGGGMHPVPGEVSLAHRGVLFLDELPEFQRNVLEVLRQPLEDGHVSISRAAAARSFPSRFMLVAAMNPCPCGYADDPKRMCRCSQKQIRNYRGRISGPLLDRIDIQIEVAPVPPAILSHLPNGEPSASIRERVIRARTMQAERYRGIKGVKCNADLPGRLLADACRLDSAAMERLRDTIASLDLSARAYDRILKVSRTIADMDGREGVNDRDICEAARYRALDQSYWL